MDIFNSYVSLPEGNKSIIGVKPGNEHGGMIMDDMGLSKKWGYTKMKICIEENV